MKQQPETIILPDKIYVSRQDLYKSSFVATKIRLQPDDVEYVRRERDEV